VSALSERLVRELGLALDDADVAALGRGARAADASADIVELAGDLLVHETWFFRDPVVFTEIERIARESGRRVRVLSAPCSTGEEAYSVAVSLIEAGLSPDEFEVLGVDVSAAALALARQGRYGRSSFRSQRREWESRFLVDDGEQKAVTQEVRRSVRFERANLVEPGALSHEGVFDVVLCRNLLIYLVPDARERVERLLGRLVAPGGTLFLGPAETAPASGFTRARGADTFRFIRSADPAPHRRRRASDQSHRAARRPSPETKPVQAPSPVVAHDARRATLEDARALADRGDLVNALSTCGRILEGGHDAEVYALVGTIESARGDKDASFRAFQRALYLDPDHPVALIWTARHWEQRGAVDRAQALYARAARPGRAR
jgi:chemotaxis protein methyltransferase WspC